MEKKTFEKYIKEFDFKNLFIELGWDNFSNELPVAIKDQIYLLKGIVQKRGFVIMHCLPGSDGEIPPQKIRKQIERELTKNHFEHLIIFTDKDRTRQIWQFVIKEENKPKQTREIRWHYYQDVDILFQRLKNLLFTLDEEEKITLVDVKARISQNLAVNTEEVTKRFYKEFKKQHTAFLDFIKGIDDHISNKENKNKQWYASLMLNRLMFCYFIQKKGFLDNDVHYLQNKLRESKKLEGKNNFYSFYRSFLLELFHDGLGKPKQKRHKHPIDLGEIPYLNGGLFDVHELEKQFDSIEIEDEAFEKIFDFFDKWNWHLDTNIEATGRDINPDVIGYIFEKYINDRAAMGAYYTKEDITEYISKNTIIPFLFDETERHYKKAFKSDSELWNFLKNSGDDYIYDAVKKGIPENKPLFDDLPEKIKKGFNPELEQKIVVADERPHLWEIRKEWNRKAPSNIALPTEIYRELIERRQRYAEVKSKIINGEITTINDFITYNLNIRQFTQDFIENTSDPEFIKHFYKAIKKITILDPTVGSGAFLFAAMNILEPLYEACIMRMEQFTDEEPGKYKFFEQELQELNTENHPNLKYFIYKNIILNNLYGVDIMKEAVEIAKLRLFLKLVATVDVNPQKPNLGLEPLPDIDFNIRAGNTLIGFATENELLETIPEVEGLFAQDKLEEFKEEIELVSKAYKHFQNAQLINDFGSEVHKKAKAELNERLKELNRKLNRYLATNYGITDPDNKQRNQYQNWLETHQPFHWFAEFYDIINGNGGFDVIIGNPPYVVYNENNFIYKIFNYETIDSKNLYAYIIERSFKLLNRKSKFGFIVPNSSISANKMAKLQDLIINKHYSWISNYSWRPGKLFQGADMLLAILLVDNKIKIPNNVYSTKYYKWYNEYRKYLFQTIYYTETLKIHGSIAKIPNSLTKNILKKLSMKKPMKYIYTYQDFTNRIYSIYYFRAVQYWFKVLDKIPLYKENGNDKITSEMKILNFKEDETKYFFISFLSSSLFFLYYIIWSSCQVVNNRDFNIPINLDTFSKHLKNKLVKLAKRLQKELQNNSEIKIRNYSKKGRNFQMEKQHFYIKLSKPIIDEIDTILAEHYGFTEEELDFIVNYDIKYRMGNELDAYIEGTLGKRKKTETTNDE